MDGEREDKMKRAAELTQNEIIAAIIEYKRKHPEMELYYAIKYNETKCHYAY